MYSNPFQKKLEIDKIIGILNKRIRNSGFGLNIKNPWEYETSAGINY
jgi:hypothetical protein